MGTYQNLGDNYFFAEYSKTTHELLYTKFNFNFELYKETFTLPFNTKSELFYDFLIRNEAVMEKPFTVKPEFKQFFTPITEDIKKWFEDYSYTAHSNYMFLENPAGYYSDQYVLDNQFELIYYEDTKYRRLQDYIYLDTVKEQYFTQYNFDFDTYSKDWNVWGPKLSIFTDFVVRTMYLNGVIIGSYGYGYPQPQFIKYFIQPEDPVQIETYMDNNAINSVYSNIYYYLFNIDFIKYGYINTDLRIYNGNYELLKNHYLKYGQFEQRTIPLFPLNNLNTKIQQITNYCATILSGSSLSSGFIAQSTSNNYVNGIKQIYLVFCYHSIMDTSDRFTVLAEVNYLGLSRKLLFKIIGYDMYTDICIGLYDPTLDYNISFNKDVDTSLIPSITIGTFMNFSISQSIYTIGNIGQLDNSSFTKGTIIDNAYSGTFNSTFSLSIPDSLLLQLNGQTGMSGAPILIGDIENPTSVECVGMINSYMGNNNQYTIGLSGTVLGTIFYNIVNRWFSFAPKINDIIKLNFFIQDGYPKKWLGTISSYYRQNISVKKFVSLKNFEYNGGLLIEEFIIGYNYLEKKCVYNVIDLVKQGAIKLDTPLLNTKMYERFIYSGRQPIIIKSIRYYDNFYGVYQKYNLGKYSRQYSFDLITYKMEQIATFINDPKYINLTYRQYMPIDFEYYYYDGNTWILTTELIGGNGPEWYNTYTDSNGYLYYQHKMEFPQIMLPYIPVYEYFIGQNTSVFPGQEMPNNLDSNLGSNLGSSYLPPGFGKIFNPLLLDTFNQWSGGPQGRTAAELGGSFNAWSGTKQGGVPR